MRNVRDRCHRQSPFHHHYSPRMFSPSFRAPRASGVCVRSLGPDLALKRPPPPLPLVRCILLPCFSAFLLLFLLFPRLRLLLLSLLYLLLSLLLSLLLLWLLLLLLLLPLLLLLLLLLLLWRLLLLLLPL